MNVSDYHKKTDDFINSSGFVTRNTHPTNKYQKEFRRGTTVVR
jgi:hypothetical protein